LTVRMFVFNNCANDARVLKEAKTLAEAGHDVEIVAFLDKKTVPEEQREGFRIKRLKLNPIHLRVIRFFGNPILYLTGRHRTASGQSEETKGRSGIFGRLQDGVERWDKKVGARVSTKHQVTLHNDSITHPESREQVLHLAKSSPTFLLQLLSFAIGYLPLKGIIVTRNLLVKVLTMLVRFFVQKPLRWILLPYHKYFTYYNFYKNALKYSRSSPCEVYHCHDLNTLKIGIELKKEQGSKLVYDSHELYLHKNRAKKPGARKLRMLVKIETEGMKLADAVITVGACIAEWLANEYQSRNPYVIHNAPAFREQVETDQELNLRKELNIKSGEFLLVYSGSITINRGLEQVIEATSRIENLRFVMMGYGKEDYLASLNKLISKFKAEEKIQFFGPVPHQEVSSYLSSADCGIAPIMNICLSYYYCAPNKLFEFIQARLPILASNFPEMEKVVNDFNLGLTFDPSDPDNIETVIREMMNNPQRRKEFQSNTHSAAKAYNWKVEEEKLVNMYSKLAS
jgi:glycosyltransferase involved in cell wall biosynthesis